jgi:hypothetical protein
MGKRKKRIFRTSEERAVWNARFEARQRELHAHMRRITAELTAKHEPR